jgi:hypothetical protein
LARKFAQLMEKKQLLELSQDQLNRSLGFFPRLDVQASILLAVNTGMLAIIASNAPSIRSFEWYMIFSSIPVVLIGLSLYSLYQQVFPRLEGGSQSLIYFQEIAKKTESQYIEAFKNQNEEAYITDLLAQIWRNSEILKLKYRYLKSAFIFTACSIIPWTLSIAMFAAKNVEAKNLLIK